MDARRGTCHSSLASLFAEVVTTPPTVDDDDDFATPRAVDDGNVVARSIDDALRR
jgi:hypothetical protein